MYMLAFLVTMNRTHEDKKRFATYRHLGPYLQYNRPMMYGLRRFLARHTMRVRWIVFGLILAAAVLLLWKPGWAYQWEWTGFGRETSLPSHIHIGIDQPAKTLWDWLQLLIIPAGLAVAGIWFTRRDQNRKDEMNETALATYINEMSHLLLDKQPARNEQVQGRGRYIHAVARLIYIGETRRLVPSPNISHIQFVTRAQTITMMRRLDGPRNRLLIQFLRESELMRRGNDAIVLRTADLSGATLPGADLRNVNLSGATLSKAILTGATLTNADLSGAILREAKLDGADLRSANLRLADLTNADLTGAIVLEDQLGQAISRKGMRQPSGKRFKG